MEIDAHGRTYSAETDYSKGTNRDGYRITDEELTKRFYNNAQIILPYDKIDRAVAALKHIEELGDICEAVKEFCL